MSEAYCVVGRDGEPQWFHIAYAQAIEDARAARATRRNPLRADLEARLEAKRSANTEIKKRTLLPPQLAQSLPAVPIYDHTDAPEPREPPPKPRPAYAYKRAPALDTVNANGPPTEGRFSMVADRPKSKRELQSGLPEITALGVRLN